MPIAATEEEYVLRQHIGLQVASDFDHQIVAGAAVVNVGVEAAIENVIAGAAAQHIVLAGAFKHIVAGQSFERVGAARQRDQPVIARGAGDGRILQRLGADHAAVDEQQSLDGAAVFKKMILDRDRVTARQGDQQVKPDRR